MSCAIHIGSATQPPATRRSTDFSHCTTAVATSPGGREIRASRRITSVLLAYAPAGPGGPLGPSMPWGPCRPWGPCSPWIPCGPSGPGAPRSPFGPGGPSEPACPGAPGGPAIPAGPGGPSMTEATAAPASGPAEGSAGGAGGAGGAAAARTALASRLATRLSTASTRVASVSIRGSGRGDSLAGQPDTTPATATPTIAARIRGTLLEGSFCPARRCRFFAPAAPPAYHRTMIELTAVRLERPRLAAPLLDGADLQVGRGEVVLITG